VSRSKRLYGVANAAPKFLGHLQGGHSAPKTQLVQTPVLLLLMPDVRSNHPFIPTYRRNEVSTARPKVSASSRSNPSRSATTAAHRVRTGARLILTQLRFLACVMVLEYARDDGPVYRHSLRQQLTANGGTAPT
jgi:hypothetical protein